MEISPSYKALMILIQKASVVNLQPGPITDAYCKAYCKIRESIQRKFADGSIDIIEDIKTRGCIMDRIKGDATVLGKYRIYDYDTAPKTAAMGRVTENSINSLGNIDPLLMDPDYCLKLDSGANINAVGDYRILDKDSYTHFNGGSYWVTLPDGSQVRILGIGSIKTEDFTIPSVCLVAGLRTNVISVSELDKLGLCCVFREKHCKVYKNNSDGEVREDGEYAVGGAILEKGLYVLRYLHVA